MIESFKEFPLLWVLIVVLAIVAVIVFILAGRAKKRLGDSPESVLSSKDLEQLKVAFSDLTEEKLTDVHDKELIFAIITNIEKRLDDGVDFNLLPEGQKNIYTLWYFVQSISGKEMCDFFKEFGEPLTTIIAPALIEIEEADLAAVVSDAANAFDDNNESISSDTITLNALNARFNNDFDRVHYYSACEKYIRANIGNFIG